MIRSNRLLKLALTAALLSSAAPAAAEDYLNLKLSDEDDYDSGRAAEIYAELRMENAKATVQLWNRSGTPYVSYKVTIRVICTEQGTAENFTGSLSSSSGSGRTLTTRCKKGNVLEATAYITRL